MNEPVFLNYTQAELDLYYDQRRWHPAAQAEIERYIASSEAARGRLHHDNHRYGPGENESLDWFPAGDAAAPVIVFVHGGAWINFTKDDFSFVAAGAVERGFHTCVLNFAGLKTVRMPEMLAQVQRGIAWVASHTQELKADARRLHVCGHSSGAHLASLALLQDHSPIHSATLISGAYELEPVMLSARRSYVLLEPAEVAALSPIRHIDRIGCPLLVAFCGNDTPEYQRHARAFHEALQRRGKVAELFHLSLANHFDSVFSLEQPHSNLLEKMAALLQS
ncbi:MAG: alpha/beta hydrolase [Xanthobacteraceae bacterium]